MVDKVAIVTGGSLGLGREIARNFIAQGYKVAIFGRNPSNLEAAKKDLDDVLPLSVDVSDSAAVTAGFAQVDAVLGPVEILINAAAVFAPFALEDATPENVLPLVMTNLCGPIYCMREAVSRMREIGRGDIVNVSSASVRFPTPYLTMYTSTKAALEAMTALMADELRPDDIRSMIFRVGQMDSDGARNMVIPHGLLQRFEDRYQKTGAAHWNGGAMEPKTAADALTRLLLTDRDARVGLFEVSSR
jgi:meso-butanediol dehydrogenase/(S,S)-butanediol dehydrogenase/diacetyl reductase